MPAAAIHRRLLTTTGLVLFPLVFGAFYFFEVPGLGIGHFYYVPVALLALAGGGWVGVGAGLAAAGLYALDIVITPRVPVRDVLTEATLLRTFTYSSVGAIIGWFASEHRVHVAQLRELAERDYLTGLLNTRIFDEALARRCTAAKPFVLVLGDMDNLKDLNNTHGHPEGNRALRQVADALAGAAGSGDEVARVGGDEFAILTGGTIEEAQAMCTMLKRRLARENVQLSFGWAAFPDDAIGPLELFRKADDRLLGAKTIGRNRRAVVSLAATAENS